MQEEIIYNAAVYARLSKEDERAGDSVSIESQVAMLTKYVSDNGWEHTATYKDDGYSGTSFDRPGFSEMMSRVRKHHADEGNAAARHELLHALAFCSCGIKK